MESLKNQVPIRADFESQMLAFISQEMKTDAAHDINHVQRVVHTAVKLAEQEGAILEVVIPAAYLHDCFTHPKNHPDRHLSSHIAANKAIEFLISIDYPDQHLAAIHHAIVAHSFSANIVTETLEARIVQDADRLDALGAVGVARCVQVGVSFARQLYSLDDPLCDNRQPNDSQYTIDHFFTKLLRLDQGMHTESARIEARRRIEFMRLYLDQLKTEF
jgi:uncharacterized protein